MLTLKNIRYHCRTCLIKLEGPNDDDSKKIVLIAKFPNIEKLMHLCLDTTDELDELTPNICRLCLDKWQEFTKHYLLAIRSDRKLRKFLEQNLEPGDSDKRSTDNKFNQIYLATETVNNICQIEKYETTSPFYHDSISNTSTSFDLPSCEVIDDGMLEEATQLQKDIGTTEVHPNFNSKCPETVQSDNDSQPDKSNKTFETSKTKRKQRTSTVCKIKRIYRTRKSVIGAQAKQYDSGKMRDNSVNNSAGGPNKKLRYHCEPCKKYFYERYKYDGHVKQIHEGIRRPYQCNDCDKAYNSYKNLTKHTAENHSEKSQDVHKCEACNKTFKTSVTLRQHINNHHSIYNLDRQKEDCIDTTTNNSSRELTRTICDKCGFMAAHQYSLVQHIKNKHTEAKEIICEHCPKIFKSQYSLKYHKLSTHNPTNTKPFQCSECLMTFTRRTLLNLHKRTHLKYTERIKCDFDGCDVRFVKHGDKRHHMRLVHLKVKQHICDFCGEAFGAMQTLRHHRYIHTGEKPYKCNVCGQAFRQRTAMKTHCKTHYGKGETVISPEIINKLADGNVV